MRTTVLAGAVSFALALMTAACSGGADLDLDEVASLTRPETSTLNTFIPESLEIDQFGDGPDDANLVLGDDADGSPSIGLPDNGPLPFVDWDDLSADLGNHQILDLDDPDSGRDVTAFPGSNECVGPANVLAKMDLTYVASANNQSYAYLAVQRSANNGDAGYYWLFTRREPRLELGEEPCRSNQRRLVYDISGPDGDITGDVLVKGHFKPSAEPLIEVFHATRDAEDVGAVDAINYLSGLWEPAPAGAVAAAAVNMTPAYAGGFGSAGVKTMDGDLLDTELFAEAAVPLWVFTGEGTVCDASFYGSVITRSSGSGGTTPDLKDLAGPAYFNFGSATATAKLEPSCAEELHFELLTATGADGQPIDTPTCTWSFNDGAYTVEDSCSGTLAVPAGQYASTVTIVDPISGCDATAPTGNVDVYAPLGADAFMDATCALSFAYTGYGTGGSGEYEYSWSFPGTLDPTSTTASGVVGVPTGGLLYTGTLTVTDLRGDLPGVCVAQAGAEAMPYGPLAVNLTPTRSAPTCPTMESDAVSFTAHPSGGDGNYVLTWNEVGCSGAECVINPDDSKFCPSGDVFVVLTDDSGLCGAVTSETETWTKVTTVTVSDN